MSNHSGGLVGSDSGHMVMRHRVAYACGNETHIADSSCSMVVHVDSCIMSSHFICETSDCLTFVPSLIIRTSCSHLLLGPPFIFNMARNLA